MARGGARPGAGRKAGKSANTSPLSRRARARARVEAGNQRPWPADKVERWAIDRLIPYAKNARTHTDAQVAAIAASIKEWGWTTPALVGEDGGLIAGHARGANTSPLSRRARARARVEAGNQRPWPADKVGRPSIRTRPATISCSSRCSPATSGSASTTLPACSKEWGWTTPALVGEDGGLIAGHARVLAARQLGIAEIPVMVAAGWTEAQKRAYATRCARSRTSSSPSRPLLGPRGGAICRSWPASRCSRVHPT